MAYKYSKGSTYQGDIYNEDDTGRNTYLDWGEDYIGLVTSGSAVLVVSGSTVGIGTDAPDYTLDVAGNVGVDEYIYHNDDPNTYIRFQDDDININCGGKSMVKMSENPSSTDIVTINNAGSITDFKVKGDNEDNLIRTNAEFDKVGILYAPTSTNDHELTIVGNVSASVNISASAFYGDGSHLEGVATAGPYWTEASSEVYYMGNVGCGVSNPTTRLHVAGGDARIDGNISASVNVSASAFYGDGSNLAGVSTTNPPWTEASSEVYYMGNVGCGIQNPSSTLHSGGSAATAITSFTGTSNSLTVNHHTVLMGSDDSSCTVTLPHATTCTGRVYAIKRIGNSGTYKVTVQSGEYIDGEEDAELEFDTQYDIKTVQSNGTQWFIIGEVNFGHD